LIGSQTEPSIGVSLEGADSATVTEWMGKLVAQLQGDASAQAVRHVSSDAGAQGLAARVAVDRDTASRLGVTASSVDDALYSAFGQRIVSTIFTETNQYRVILEARPGVLASVQSLGDLNLKTGSGEATPLSAFARITEERAPLQITHVAQYPASTLNFDTAPGVALGDDLRLPRSATAQVGKEVVRAERETRRTAVNDNDVTGAVTDAGGGDAEQLAESVACHEGDYTRPRRSATGRRVRRVK